jgi:hypothetical protein
MRTAIILIPLLAVLFWSCEKNKTTPVDYSVAQPYLLAASVVSQHFNLDDATNGAVTRLPDGTYRISDSITVQIIDPVGSSDLVESSYRTYAPNSGTPLLVHPLNRTRVVPGSGTTDTITFAGRFSFIVDSLNLGTYRIEVFAQYHSGFLSNSVFVPLVVTVNNQPPRLDPPTVRYSIAPGGASALFTLTIPASDPDGIADIASVAVRRLFTSDTSALPMFDDGRQDHGDRIAGDGIFSATFQVDTASLHSIEFEFSAVDRAGAPSNTVLKTLFNRAPTIVSLTIPDSIQRPSIGTQLITFFMSVADSDGLSDIDSVYFRNFSSNSPTNILMYDDGDSVHGDVTAHDGIYSRIVSIDQSASLGIKEFHFYVVDNAGYRDERIKLIKIYP